MEQLVVQEFNQRKLSTLAHWKRSKIGSCGVERVVDWFALVALNL